MKLRVATLNLEQDHKRWEERRHLITAQLKGLDPDLLVLNEICVPKQTGRWLRQAAKCNGSSYALVQLTKAGEDSRTQAEGLLTRLPIVETGNLDYRSHDCVALVVRFEVDRKFVDVYITHLIAAKIEDSARRYQVSQLLEWIGRRDDADYSVVCGDFNAAPNQSSIALISAVYRATQSDATAFTPLREPRGEPTHPEWPRFDRCIDYIWVSASIRIHASGLCFDRPAEHDSDLWPSDHVGVWADLEIA